MYVEWEAPASSRASGPPWVLVHGGGGQGTDYLTTPDGRLGWSRLLVEQGHTVYVVDRPGHGRSPFHPDVLGPIGPQMGAQVLRPIFVPPAEGPDSHPSAALHTQWPGGREPGDPVYDQWLAPLGPDARKPGRHAGARAGAAGRAARPGRAGRARYPLAGRPGHVPRRRRAPGPGGGADRDRGARAAVRQAPGDGARPRLGPRERPADVRPAGGQRRPSCRPGRRAGCRI